MLNAEDFIKRLEFIMDHFNLNASSLADKVSVQRSSISHLLSGRNKPSLDFVLKIIDEFPDVNLYWLLNGKGGFSKNAEDEIKPQNAKITTTLLDKIESSNELHSDKKTVDIEVKNEDHLVRENLKISNEKEIARIVYFFADGTFQDFKPTL